MTISTATRKAGPFLGNGVTSSFPFTFKCFSTSDIQVVKTSTVGVDSTLTLNSDYSVALNVDQNASPGGTITYPIAGTLLQTGEKLTATGVLSPVQSTHITNGGNFFANNIEDQFDYVTILVQQHEEKLSRVALASSSDLNPVLSIGTAVQRALKYITFDVNGNVSLAVALPSGTLSRGSIGGFLWPQIPSEIAATIVPSDLGAAPLTPNRYPNIASWSAVYNAVNSLSESEWPFYRGDHALHPSLTNCIAGYQSYNDSLLTGTIGYRCTAFGVNALQQNFHSTVAGGSNTAVGYACLQNNIEGSGNTGVGALVLSALPGVAGVDANHHNTAGGYRALSALTNGVQNSAWGFQAGNLIQTGNNNCVFGDSALSTAVTINGVVSVGQNSLFSKTAGDNTVAIGMNAGFSETTAVGSIYVGFQAGFQCVAQGGNTIIGYQPCGNSAEPGANNVVIGFNAGQAMNRNAGVGNAELCVIAGYQAGLRLTGGSQNVILGQQAGNFATSGSEHVILGPNAGQGITTAIRNVSIGSTSGVNLNGNNNTSVGYNAGSQASAQTFTNCGSLGANAVPTASNQITLGDSSIVTVRAQVTSITALSDIRFKKNIQPLDVPDGFLDELQIVAFDWLAQEMAELHGRQVGVIAQQLDALQDKYGVQWLNLVDKSDPLRWEATPGKLLFLLIQRTQKQQKQLASFEQRLVALESA